MNDTPAANSNEIRLSNANLHREIRKHVDAPMNLRNIANAYTRIKMT